ncbi:hypothetical protein FACS189415_4650 [Bacteroidia bacterium]|nr:hypothetical protein FACS189415_4650 [Bacteroidia bacterium]
MIICNLYISTAQPVYQHGQLRVEGAHIVDMDGHKVALRGISLGWHNWWPQFYTPSIVEYLSHDWDISIIRVAMGVEPTDGYLENPEKSERIIRTVIDAAIANGIYVIVDWHSHTIHTGEAQLFFSTIAQQYSGHPNIIYEIFNEPEGNISWEEIREYSISIIQSIREYDNHNLIIVPTPTWSQDVDMAAGDPILDYSNILYSLHFYAASHEHLRPKVEYAVKMGLPIFVSECSPSAANGNGKLDKKRFSRWLEFLKQNDIGFVLWGLYDKEESSAMLKPGSNDPAKWPLGQLTEMGAYSRLIVSGKRDPTKTVFIIGVIFIAVIVLAQKLKKNIAI